MKQAVMNRFVGECHLTSILAVESEYLKSSGYSTLTKTYISEYQKAPRVYVDLDGTIELDTQNPSVRWYMWDRIIGFWTLGNYTNFQEKKKSKRYNFITMYNYDAIKRKLESRPIKEKLFIVDNIYGDRGTNPNFEKWEIEHDEIIKSPKFIKLEDLRNFISDKVGISLPLSLFPNDNVPDKIVSSQEKLRPSQQAKLNCRKIAADKWNENPSITISDMICDDDIVSASKKKMDRST